MESFFKLLFQNHPEFANEIEGVSDEEIQKLEQLTFFSLIPNQYKTFLKYMGKNMGRIKCILKQKSHLSEDKFEIYKKEVLIDYNQIYKHYKINRKFHEKSNTSFSHIVEDLGEKAENFFLFGIDTTATDSVGFFLDLRKKECPVVEIWDDGQIREKSPSFIEFVFINDFKREVSTYNHNKKWITNE